MKLSTVLFILGAAIAPTAVVAATDQPQDVKAAISYVKLLSQEKINLTGDTALSPHCELGRRKQIREQIEFYLKTSINQDDVLTLESKKVEGDFAALLLRAENPTSPLGTRIHALAMLKRGGVWKPAPLPGSFANTGYGYDPEVEKTVRSLELWMAREKIKRETSAREEASNKFLTEISAREKTAGLDDISPEKAVTLLIEALRSKDLMRILAIMGAASDESYEPLKTTISQVSRGLNEDDPANDWQLVNNRSVIAQVMKVDKTKNEVAVGFWNPLGKTEEKILYFPVFKAKGKTFARLSELLKVALLPEDERWQQRWRHRRGDETTLRKKLPSVIFKNNTGTSQPTSRQLLDELLKINKTGDFSALLSLLPRKGEYFGKEENQKKGLQALGALWRNLNWMKANPLHVLDLLEEEDIALAPLQFAKTNRPGEFETVKVWMTKLDDGWHVIPAEILEESQGKEAQVTMQKLQRQLNSIQQAQQEKQARELMDKVVTITPPLKLDPVTDEEAKKTLTNFRTLLRTKETASALASSAVLEGTNSAQTLKIFNYAIRGAADHTPHDDTLGINRAGKWLGISIRTTSKSSGVADYPLYLIVNTDAGGKVLLDVDLRHATNRGRELLNSKTWNKLKEALPEQSLTEVKSIFDKHNQLSTADIAKRKKELEDED
ncbi:hypothetical protein NT6N_12190 [Oceaniferula spumae]|uniref:Uncharacterized protein n=1 Tax=Oceaniferula spumae TaxID=2979115 RepID=A0AAT9FJN6_9BACT